MSTDEGIARQTQCGQCGKEAIVSVNGARLCVSCYYEFETARTIAF
jgi:hypothetical protein